MASVPAASRLAHSEMQTPSRLRVEIRPTELRTHMLQRIRSHVSKPRSTSGAGPVCLFFSCRLGEAGLNRGSGGIPAAPLVATLKELPPHRDFSMSGSDLNGLRH